MGLGFLSRCFWIWDLRVVARCCWGGGWMGVAVEWGIGVVGTWFLGWMVVSGFWIVYGLDGGVL